jgi:mannitol-specific phosphotransferase system IIBC component
MLVTPPGGHLTVLLAIAASAAVSFGVGYVLLKSDKSGDGDFEAAKAKSRSYKN